ncbi:hypothetical protein [Flaviaesturariibacter aridisoli]|uniref:Preprotein translocase subunit SecB n=1 Tax=Flaviaesturariibacter aridisoli TaxID=2545761 RepID=A0A4R4E0Z5_9BACT|nr:hypothetical protein [Flaviaesturariibacter aridisoli]TCZ71802.1 hypothetical protein E0486_09640 [Flaviaesturariibacter aridisoli]
MAQAIPQLQLKALEVLHAAVSVPQEPNVNIGNFHFNINLDTKADAPNKLLVLIVQVEIKNEDQQHMLGSLVLSNIFEIANFEQVITVEYGGNLNVPPQLTEMLANQAIATARGAMFGLFKGTFLHNAVLPLIDMRPQEQQQGQ